MRILFYIITFGLACFVWALIEAQLFRVNKITIKSKKIRGKIKVVFISDLHYSNYYYKSRLERIVKKINRLDADLILLGGDYLDFEKKSKFNKDIIKELFRELTLLKAKQGVFTILGNHDYYLEKHLSYMLGKIRANNITLIKNSTIKVNIENNIILLHGVDDLQEGEIDISKLLVDEEAFNILLSHNPDFFEEYKVSFDIGLSGHLHGGQVNFFGLYAPQTESNYGQKYIKEINKQGEATIITTKGLGCSSLPKRFFAMPEIVLCEIEEKTGACN